MRKRLHNKMACIAILTSLIIISLGEIVIRGLILQEQMLGMSTFGEPLMTAIFAAAILIFAAKGKDRVCYICFGAWLGYFVLDQLFELPGLITAFVALRAEASWVIDLGALAFIARILSMITIIAIGVLLVEYMNDGTIYNRAFNALCVITVLLILFNVAASVILAVQGQRPMDIILQAANNVSRLTMVFLFTFFAYDSAKHQLSKTNLSK